MLARSCISVGTREDEKEARRSMSPRLPTFAKNKDAKVGHPPADPILNSPTTADSSRLKPVRNDKIGLTRKGALVTGLKETAEKWHRAELLSRRR